MSEAPLNFLFRDKAITGLLLVVPENETTFISEMGNFQFPLERSLKLKQVMGYDTHRIVEGAVCVSDLVVRGFDYLFESGHVSKNSIDGLVLVTQTPDYVLPPTSSVIQGRLGLKRNMFCIDINQGCAGFVFGLMQSFMLLDQPAIERVALVNADVLSRRISNRDRNSYPLVGDAASISIIDRSSTSGLIHSNIMMDGSRYQALIVPAGGMRLPSSPETAILTDAGDGNFRAQDHLRMDGSAVFNFVQVEVPPLIENLLEKANIPKAAVDYFLCHQPNQFMLQKLADKLGVPYEKMPMNVVGKYGNSSGVTIPTAIALNLNTTITKNHVRVVMTGFGVGLTWCSLTMQLGPMNWCETINLP